MTHPIRIPAAPSALALAALLALGGCASMGGPMGQGSGQAAAARGSAAQHALPAAVQVPAGHQVAMETVGTGTVTYACRAKKDESTAFEWTFVGPDAQLSDRSGRRVGRYWGPPATWESMDGSKVTATQVAVAPAGSGNLPLQLVQAHPAMGQGAMQGVSYIQRLAVQGGAAPTAPCSAANAGAQQTLPYQADYIFWRADGGGAGKVPYGSA